MIEVIYKEESYDIIGACMELHHNLGAGFLEEVYKGALEYEFKKRAIPFERERKYEVNYKEIVLPHTFYADFVVFGKIILKVKAVVAICDQAIAQSINYLKVSNNKLAMVVNFGEPKLNYKRLVLEKKNKY